MTTCFRIGQTLSVAWEKTPENLLYDAVMAASAQLKGSHLVEFTATEDVHVRDYLRN